MRKQQQEVVPVYLVTGFLESGKTSMIHTMMEDEGFSRGQRTLLICCEEGELEYDEALLKKSNTTVVILDDASEMTEKKMIELDAKYKPERVFMEYNSVWTIGLLGRTLLPALWEVVQIITMVDGQTFDNYMTNMRQLLTDPIKVSDLVLVNRCEPGANKSPWRRQIKAINQNCTIIFENTDGTSEDGVSDEDLPYNMKAPIIEISDEQIGIFYMDALDHPDRYDGKTVRMVGQPFPDKAMPKGYYLFGREAMTCCANDIAKVGWVCQGVTKPNPRLFIKLTAKCSVVTASDGQAAIMLHETQVEKANAPKEKYVTFS